MNIAAGLPNHRLRIRHAFEKRDWEAVSDSAHALRSISLTLGLEKVGSLCGGLEERPSAASNEFIEELDRGPRSRSDLAQGEPARAKSSNQVA